MNIDFYVTIGKTTLNLSGFIVGICTYLFILVGCKITILCEYYFTKRFWIVFCILGIACIIASLISQCIITGAIYSIGGFTLLWGIGEIIQQEKRVEKGWFPKNPKRK